MADACWPPRLAVAAGRSAQLLKPIAGVSDILLWSPEAGGSSMLVDTATQSARVPIKFDPRAVRRGVDPPHCARGARQF
eukprot:COSAG01_NODE_10239_length_2212_cov_1.716990_1_plen_79_part_00